MPPRFTHKGPLNMVNENLSKANKYAGPDNNVNEPTEHEFFNARVSRTIEGFSIKDFSQFAALSVIIILILSFGITTQYSSVSNMLFSPPKFNLTMALEEKRPISIYPHEKYNINAIEITDKDMLRDAFNNLNKKILRSVTADQDTGYDYTYNQFGKYKFKLEPDEMYETGLSYETTYTTEGVNSIEHTELTHKIIVCTLNDVVILAKVPFDYDISSGQPLKGSFLPFIEREFIDIKTVFEDYKYISNVFSYEFDTTAYFFAEESLSLFTMAMLIIIILFFIIRVAVHAFFKKRRYIYKKLDRLMGDEAVVNEQLKTAIYDGKRYFTDDWIITPRLFKTEITRNCKNK